jgi:hypothetical protein
MSKNDDNTPPESLTLRLKKAETAVEVATVGRRLWIVNHHALRSRLLKLPGSHAHSQWRREEPG